MPASTVAASASTRRAIFLSGAPSAASTCQPSSRVQFCHWTASAASIRAIAGVGCGAAEEGWGAAAGEAWAAGGAACAACGTEAAPGTAAGCATAARASKLMAQAPANPLGQFFNVIRFLDRGHGDDIEVVLLQVEFQLLREIHQVGGVFEILLVLGLEDFVGLLLAAGQGDFPFTATTASAAAASLLEGRARQTGHQAEERATSKNVFHG